MNQFESNFIDGFIHVNKFFQQHHIRYCLIGGIAAGFWGEPRYTQDMDFTVVSLTGSLIEIRKMLLKEHHQISNTGDEQLRITGHEKTKFIADLILANTEYQDWVIQRAITVDVFQIPVPICTPEDLIILKLIANRRQDLLDIENIIKHQEYRLDGTYLKNWMKTWDLHERFVKEFGKKHVFLK